MHTMHYHLANKNYGC